MLGWSLSSPGFVSAGMSFDADDLSTGDAIFDGLERREEPSGWVESRCQRRRGRTRSEKGACPCYMRIRGRAKRRQVHFVRPGIRSVSAFWPPHTWECRLGKHSSGPGSVIPTGCASLGFNQGMTVEPGGESGDVMFSQHRSTTRLVLASEQTRDTGGKLTLWAFDWSIRTGRAFAVTPTGPAELSSLALHWQLPLSLSG